MAQLVWGSLNVRKYESGLDRGVFYDSNSVGSVWDGLISVNRQETNTPIASYFDGTKFLNLPGSSQFQAVVKSVSEPDAFRLSNGEQDVVPGFALTGQPRKSFGFSWRTLIDGGRGYRLHVVYNAMAIPAVKSYKTQAKTNGFTERSWTVDTFQSAVSGMKPSSYFYVDSTESPAARLKSLEDLLYGTASVNAALPTPAQLVNIFKS